MQITVPTRDTVSPANQAMFDALKGQLGMVPNLYATLAHSQNALGPRFPAWKQSRALLPVNLGLATHRSQSV